MSWQLNILEPTGERRIVALKDHATLGKTQPADIILRDPTLPNEPTTLWAAAGEATPFWIKIPLPGPPATLGDIPIREAQLPPGIPLTLGETQLVLEPDDHTSRSESPPFPSGMRPWHTCTPEGRTVLWTARKAASTHLSIYIAGETGTGKEIIAHLIHAWSNRKSGPFVPIHCGALPGALAESELFGHVKGAFTGAIYQRTGALLQAHNGTLFLDEIGDLPLEIQVKLLRFLENGEIRPVGADRISHANVRIVCATHQSLNKLVEEGKFRRDLYYRLASITIELPPLRTRPNDVKMLATRFASELRKTLSPLALLRLQAHTWPGNIRELRHCIERATGLTGNNSVLRSEAFDFLLDDDKTETTPPQTLGNAVLTFHEMERHMLIKTLRLTEGNRAKAARILGIARSTLFEKLRRHRLPSKY